MSGVNKVILVGRLGSDPDLKYTPSGIGVAKFSLATSEKFTDREGNSTETTEWHKIVVWNKLAENCAKFLGKGKQAYVEGKIQTVSWDDKQSGQKRYATEIVAHTVQFLDAASPRPDQPQRQQQAPMQGQGQAPAQTNAINLEEIPF